MSPLRIENPEFAHVPCTISLHNHSFVLDRAGEASLRLNPKLCDAKLEPNGTPPDVNLSSDFRATRRCLPAALTFCHLFTSHAGPQPTQNGAHGRSGPQSPLVSGPRQVVLRLATNRVQHEIEEATRRELELREEGKAITTSEETVDEKVRPPMY